MSAPVFTLYSQLQKAHQQEIQYLENCVKSLALDGSNAAQVIKDIDAQISLMLKDEVWRKRAENLVNVQRYLRGLKWTAEHLDRGDNLSRDKEGLKLVIDRISKITNETMFSNPGPHLKGILDHVVKCSKVLHFKELGYTAAEKQMNALRAYIDAAFGLQFLSYGKDRVESSPNVVKKLLRAGLISIGHDRFSAVFTLVTRTRQAWERSLKEVICHLVHYEDINKFSALMNFRACVQSYSEEWIYFLVEEAGLQMNTDLHIGYRDVHRLVPVTRLFDVILSDPPPQMLGHFPPLPIQALVFSGAKITEEFFKDKSKDKDPLRPSEIVAVDNHAEWTIKNRRAQYAGFRPFREQVEKENEEARKALILLGEKVEIVMEYFMGGASGAKGMRMECQRRFAASLPQV